MRPSPHGAGDVECLLVGFAMAALTLTDQVTGTVRVRTEPDDGEVGALMDGLGPSGRLVSARGGHDREVRAIAAVAATSVTCSVSAPLRGRLFRCPYMAVRGTFSMPEICATLCSPAS